VSIKLDGVSVVSMVRSVISDVSLAAERGVINILPGLTGRQTHDDAADGGAPSSGRILADGNYVAGTSVREPSVAMYHQFMNSPSLTVFEKIASPPRVAKDDRTRERGRSGWPGSVPMGNGI